MTTKLSMIIPLVFTASALVAVTVCVSNVTVRQQTWEIPAHGTVELPIDVLAVTARTGCNVEIAKPSAVASRLDGRRVRISGTMYPTFEERGLKSFWFIPETKFRGFNGMAAEIPLHAFIPTQLKSGARADYQNQPFVIEGVLSINVQSDEDGVYAIYELREAQLIQTDVRLKYQPAVGFGC